MYSGELKENAKNDVHGHVDADAILTSLIEWIPAIDMDEQLSSLMLIFFYLYKWVIRFKIYYMGKFNNKF